MNRAMDLMTKAGGIRHAVVAFGILFAAILLAPCPSAFGADLSLDVSQYAHTSWKIRDGFTKGTITSIAQTPDGYLWLGTEFGLLRFDGVRYLPWQPSAAQHLPNNYVHSLLAARDGRLWIGTSEGLASWKDGKLTRYPEMTGQSVSALLEDREGTVWAAGHASSAGELCSIHGGKIQCHGKEVSFGQYVDLLSEDRAGNLWVAGITGLWRWKPGPPKLYPMPDRVQALMAGENGSLAIAMLSGIRQFTQGKLDVFPLPDAKRRFPANEMLRDRDGGLWIGTTDRGLVHVHQGRADAFQRSDGLSGDFIKKIFEDREGNIWVATLDGLDRFHNLAVPTISVGQGLSNATVESVLAARDGSVWLGTADGLNHWNDGRITVYRKSSGLPDDAIQSLFQDFRDQLWVSTRQGVAFLENGRFTSVSSVPGGVRSIDGDQAGNIWVSQNESLFHLRDGRVIERIPWTQLGHPDGVRALVADPSGGGLWFAFLDGGVGYFKEGQVRTSYTVADGLSVGHSRDLQLDREGTLWASTEGGLSRLQGNRFITLNSKNGLPCDDVHSVIEDNDHSFWLYTACGLLRLARPELDAWVAAANTDPMRQIQMTVFDSPDGVRAHSTTTGYNPGIAKSADGRLWFLPWDGVSIVDPRNLAFNELPPPVRVEQISADRRTYDVSSNVRLPALVRDLEIDYTALSLVAAEKVRFRVKLEGRDSDWKDVGNERKAFYNDLAPGKYQFRVMASNNSGVWNEAGAVLDFSIAPAYYQTAWFRLSGAALFLVLLGGLYQRRERQMARQFSMRLEERVNERTRIARELHDTLLQSFQGVLLKFHAATFLLPDRPSDARNTLEGAIEQARDAIAEGRDAVQGLRSPLLVTNNLGRAIGLVGEGFVSSQAGPNAPAFRIEIEGTPRDLVPLLQDEVYRIACEALRNAFKHAQAGRVEVEIRYGQRQFRLRIRDDGKGIDAKVLTATGREGHYGLPGMKERARLLGGTLAIWSELNSGTEIELTIPGSIAYAKLHETSEPLISKKGS